MNPELGRLRARCNVVPRWFHRISIKKVGNDWFQTPGTEPAEFSLWKIKAIPAVAGKKCLDVGAWDGLFTFYLREQGASDVLAIDSYQNKVGMKGFELARELLNEVGRPVDGIRYLHMDVRDLPSLKEEFDVSLFFGTIYHLEDPYMAMKVLARLTRQCMVLEGHFIKGDDPIGYFYNPRQLNNDDTNYWGLTLPCIVRMATRAGFKKHEMVDTMGDRCLIRFFKE